MKTWELITIIILGYIVLRILLSYVNDYRSRQRDLLAKEYRLKNLEVEYEELEKRIGDDLNEKFWKEVDASKEYWKHEYQKKVKALEDRKKLS